MKFEPCKGCEVLKQQLDIANEEKKLYHDTFLEILKPKVSEPISNEIRVPAIPQGPMLLSRRKAILAEEDRQRARVEANSPHIARSDNDIIRNAEAKKDINPTTEESIKALEKELGLGSEESEEKEEANAVR